MRENGEKDERSEGHREVRTSEMGCLDTYPTNRGQYTEGNWNKMTLLVSAFLSRVELFHAAGYDRIEAHKI